MQPASIVLEAARPKHLITVIGILSASYLHLLNVPTTAATREYQTETRLTRKKSRDTELINLDSDLFIYHSSYQSQERNRGTKPEHSKDATLTDPGFSSGTARQKLDVGWLYRSYPLAAFAP